MIGYVSIPTIDVELPIYEGTREDILYRGVGHLSSSSLPTGDKGTHAVLTGHSGLAAATLFSNLNKLEVNDTFTVTFLDETYTYKVNQIVVVDPDDSDKYLQIKKNKCYCTLITCTNLNSQRLLVRGVRVPNTSNTDDSEKLSERLANQVWAVIAAIVALVCILLVFATLAFIRHKRQKRRIKQNDTE